MREQKTLNKKVQGAWIEKADGILLADEAKKQGFKTATALVSHIISEWCYNRRIELAEAFLNKARRRRIKNDDQVEVQR